LRKQKELLAGYKIYIAITGDIVFAGNDNESYSNFDSEFNQKLNDIGITKDFRLIVPGNHDIDQNIKVSKDKIHKNITYEQTFNNFISDGKYQNDFFENYILFNLEFAKYGIGYSPEGKGWVINDNLGVYCLNTALCSFGGIKNNIDDKNQLAIYTRGIVDWCKKNKTTQNILLMHHPITHLNEWSKKELIQLIEKNFFLCLCGHNHEQDIYYNKISHKSLICLTPQLFTNKKDLLGYAIIPIERDSINRIIYREYVKGKFLKGSRLSENDEGTVHIQNNYSNHLNVLKLKLKNAIAFFKDQPEIFIKPKLAKDREFNNEKNLLDQIIKEPKPTIIVAQPQFGLTCLSHYMRLEAFKLNNFWIYLNAKHIKARNIQNKIEEQLQSVDKKPDDIKCIIIDSWNSSIIDHSNIPKNINNDYKNMPIIVMSNYSNMYFESSFDLSKLNIDFSILHLQALQRNKVRELVSKYNQQNNIANDDIVVTKVVKDLEALNVHRTPFNCLTLLKVFEKNFNENLVNRTKMIKAVLFFLKKIR